MDTCKMFDELTEQTTGKFKVHITGKSSNGNWHKEAISQSGLLVLDNNGLYFYGYDSGLKVGNDGNSFAYQYKFDGRNISDVKVINSNGETATVYTLTGLNAFHLANYILHKKACGLHQLRYDDIIGYGIDRFVSSQMVLEDAIAKECQPFGEDEIISFITQPEALALQPKQEDSFGSPKM